MENKIKENKLDNETSASDSYYVANIIKEYVQQHNGDIPEMFNPYNKAEIVGIAPTQTTQCSPTGSSSAVLIKENNKQGYKIAHEGDGINVGGRMIHQRGNVQNGMRQTIKTNGNDGGVCVKGNYNVEQKLRIRKLTPCECMKLMGFEESDYLAMKEVGLSDSAIYHCAGDSIVATCIMSLLSSFFGKDHISIVEQYVDNIVNRKGD